MKYIGKLYGKQGGVYFPLIATTEDVDKMESDLATTRHQLAIARAALEKIVEWGPFPDTGRNWSTGEPMSYGAAFGSNGERDFMRNIAKEALDAIKKEGEV